MKSKLALAALLITTLAAPGLAAGSGHDQAAIKRAREKWVRAYNDRDLEGVMAIWSEEVIGWFPGQQDITYASTKDSYARSFADQTLRTQVELVINEIQVCGELAIVRDTWYVTQSRPGTSDVLRRIVKSFELWRKQPEGWKIIRWMSFPDAERVEPKKP